MIHKDIKIAVRLHPAKTRGQSVCRGGEGGEALASGQHEQDESSFKNFHPS